MPIPDPWRRIAADWPAVPVLRRSLDPHLHAETRWLAGRPVAVVLNRDLTQVQARCAVAHECEHLERGQPCASLQDQIERRVTVATARYLLPDIDALGTVLAAYDLRRAAEELWVTLPVLLDRVGSMTRGESALVRRRAPDVA